MPLTYHETVSAPSTFSKDSKSATSSKLNANFDVCEGNEQAVENRLEDSLYDAFGSAVLSGLQPSPSYGTALSFDVTAGVALVGHTVSIGAGTVAVTASMNPGYVYLKQDGTFYDAGATATPPSACSSFLYAQYTSDGYDCLTVTLQNCGVEFCRIDADVIGALSTGTIKRTYSERDIFVDLIAIVVGDSGDYNSTTVDVHAGNAGATPSTIFTTTANRPSVASLAAANSADTGVPDTRVIRSGQVITFEVDEAATNATDLSIVLKGRYFSYA